MIKIFIAALLITKSKGRWTSAYLSGGKDLHGLIIALLTRYTPYAVSFFFSKISYFSGGNPTIFPRVCRLGVVRCYFALSLRWSLLPHSKGRLSLSELSCYVWHLLSLKLTDGWDRSFSLLKKAHHFFLRAVRCHLVIYFRVYPKITYQLPSLWHSRLSPHAMFVDTDGSPFGRTIKTAVFHSMVKVATRARNIPFWPSSCAVSFIYFWLWSLSHHVCDDHRCVYIFNLS